MVVGIDLPRLFREGNVRCATGVHPSMPIWVNCLCAADPLYQDILLLLLEVTDDEIVIFKKLHLLINLARFRFVDTNALLYG